MLEGRLRGSRLLVVEPHDDHQLLIRAILCGAGADVTIVASRAEAIDAARRSFISGEIFAAVILELRLPDGDGVRSASELRRVGYSGPILILTSDVIRAQELSRETEIVDFWMNKPFEGAVLIRMLIALIRS